ncbi:1-acyl-sn-glycerol-3-phosphate acyltransferase [Sulfurimonas gotlandica GD1]|jgi:1-acyl-sn-glycerol-3-phosphate acyltransferase|uniref:1-acyl-sn-glycerol-3-phosphate acyltransferase n=1 Tax=Sulfurimonas gotlandica (strain DSM 19862 / JCM 16533 / GD1) TaxID=929558 RepID=B6BMG2_SULGG|nr:lysophospholipid acyltransferase family protein [Sulfurimonas gotlandica]EDZ61827.1 1-acyl-sn-glycerol-3-phosphate acyltransferase [Sulfurimonas gotlandica GD1]EHP29259.1 1-acyl-sn-glycerol-3-phosphate acyltransferase [Sulfurimonas gotlandica GD1]
MKIFARISWLFATIVIFSSLTLMIVLYYLVPRPYSRKISAWIIRLTTFFSVDIKGKEDPKAQMFLLNHQSDLDIAIMETITKKDLTWVAKKELFAIPFFGLALRLPEDIAVERESKTSLLKLLKDAKNRLDKDRIITMFPEGTRSSKGKMLPFKSGAKMVADKFKLHVQPIVLIQTAKYYNVKEFYYKPGRIKVIYMDSFVADRSDKDWLNDLRVKMQKVYDDELANNTSNR